MKQQPLNFRNVELLLTNLMIRLADLFGIFLKIYKRNGWKQGRKETKQKIYRNVSINIMVTMWHTFYLFWEKKTIFFRFRNHLLQNEFSKKVFYYYMCMEKIKKYDKISNEREISQKIFKELPFFFSSYFHENIVTV